MKAKDVRGFMVEKRVPDQLFRTGFNEAIDQQGEREITLNRNKLAEKIYKIKCNFRASPFTPWNNMDDSWPMRTICLEEADAIIAAEADIIESPTKDRK